MNRRFLLSCVGLSLFSAVAYAAVFAKYDGIDGESEDSTHEGWIEILAIDWGMHIPDGDAKGKENRDPVVDELTLTMKYEASSARVQEMLLNRETIRGLSIDHTKTRADGETTYLQYELEDIIITSVSLAGVSSDEEAGRPSVKVKNSFGLVNVTYVYFVEDDNGNPRERRIEWDYDVQVRIPTNRGGRL